MSITADISSDLRAVAVRRYKSGEKSDDDLACLLGVLPTTIQRMLSEPDWSIERGIRFLEALGCHVEMKVS